MEVCVIYRKYSIWEWYTIILKGAKRICITAIRIRLHRQKSCSSFFWREIWILIRLLFVPRVLPGDFFTFKKPLTTERLLLKFHLIHWFILHHRQLPSISYLLSFQLFFLPCMLYFQLFLPKVYIHNR